MTTEPDDLLPGNATAWERAVSRTSARLLEAPTAVITTVIDPWRCPAVLLPWLAERRAVRVFDPTWPAARQRQEIANSYPNKRIAGTPAGVDGALSTLPFPVGVVEWFEYGGQPYRFQLQPVLAPGVGMSAREQRTMVRQALAAKNVRSRLEIVRAEKTETPIGLFIGIAPRATLTIRPCVTGSDTLAIRANTYRGVLARASLTIRPV